MAGDITTKKVQQRLAQAATLMGDPGLHPGPADGYWGSNTEQAWQNLFGLAEGRLKPTKGELDANDTILAEELEIDEGFVPHAYKDSLGYLTIGIGRLIDKKKGGAITYDEAIMLKRNDIARVKAEFDRRYPQWRDLDPVRQRAVLNMGFQLGPRWPDEFDASSKLIWTGQYKQAAANLRQSLWARQTPERAGRVIRMIETGQPQH